MLYARTLLRTSLAACCALVAPAQAQILTWDGGGTNNNWSTVGNWNPEISPLAASDLWFAGVNRTQPFNDLTGVRVFSIEFAAAIPTFVVSGNPFTLLGAGQPVVTNRGSASQIINNDIALIGSGGGIFGTLFFNGAITTGGAVSVGGVSAVTFNGPIGGAGSLTASGGAVQVQLNAANTYTGATRIGGNSTVSLGASDRIADVSAIEFVSGAGGPPFIRFGGFSDTVGGLRGGVGVVDLGGGHLTLAPSATEVSFATVSGSGSRLVMAGTGSQQLAGSLLYTGGTEVRSGTLVVGTSSGGGLPTGGDVLVQGGTLTSLKTGTSSIGALALNGGTASFAGLVEGTSYQLASGTLNAALAGASGVVKNTAGVVTLGGQNAYTGATQVNGGTLRLAAQNALPGTSAVSVAAGSALDLNGFSTAIGSLAGSGTVALGTGATLTVGGNNFSTIFSGTVSGAPDNAGIGGLNKVGSGTLVLSGQYQHSGWLVVEGGSLDLPNGLASSGNFVATSAGARLLAQGFVNRPLQNFGTVVATGDLILGPISGSLGVIIEAGGVLDVGTRRVQLVNRSFASVIAGSVRIAEGGRLTAFDQEIGLDIDPGGAISASGNAFVDGNVVNDGLVTGPSAQGKALVFSDNVTGTGGYAGNVTFLQDFSPGASPARISMGNASFAASSNLIMELAGAASYDRLDVAGLLDLDGGLLTVALIDGFAPQAGQRFDLFDFADIDGEFGQVLLPQLSQGLFWNTSSLYLDGSIAVAIPEPETYALLLAGLGLLGFAAARRSARSERLRAIARGG